MGAAKILKSVLPVVSAFCAPVSVQANEARIDSLLKTESVGLSSIASVKLLDLVKRPVSPSAVSASSVKFSSSWLDAQPKATGDADWVCLSEALYFEARGESVKGQFAVAEVIMNRVAHSRFPDTLCGVINQGTGKKFQCQFTYTCDGKAEHINEPKSYARVSKVARAVIDGRAPKLTNGATHYHTTAVNPSWARVFPRVATIGVHVFYRHNG